MKRVLSILLSVALIFTFAACGKTEKAPAEEPDVKQEEPVEAPVEEPEPEEVRPAMTTSLDAYPLSEVTDDLLVLINKTHKITEDYAADDLVTVEHCDTSVGTESTRKMRKIAADAVEELIAGAKEAGFDIVMRTGYRSYDYQDYLFNYWVEKDGVEAAEQYSARPGTSEHQSGLCCDLGRIGYSLSSFDDSQEAVWVAENGWKYGFILRYPKDKMDITGYKYESWHIRYVGLEAAKIIYDEGLTLEEYLGILD